MQCFNHTEVDAVAICKSCGKALCKSCSTEITNGIACKNSCERRVNMLNQMIDNNEKMIATSNVNIKTNAISSIVFGILFALMGLYLYYSNDFLGCLFMVMGVSFIVIGIIRLNKKTQYPELPDQTQSHGSH